MIARVQAWDLNWADNNWKGKEGTDMQSIVKK